jgi:hypothetical protein
MRGNLIASSLPGTEWVGKNAGKNGAAPLCQKTANGIVTRVTRSTRRCVPVRELKEGPQAVTAWPSSSWTRSEVGHEFSAASQTATCPHRVQAILGQAYGSTSWGALRVGETGYGSRSALDGRQWPNLIIDIFWPPRMHHVKRTAIF